jgi:SNF family Na+-dependent transporter
MWNPTKIYLEEKTETPQGLKWIRVEEVVGTAALAQAQADATENASLRITTLSTWEQLKRPKLWLAAAGQIFFSLAVGFGVIATYASYLSKKDDIVLSALTATSANEFTEVGLGGLITIPAGVAFLGVAGMASNTSLFSLGFHVLPIVFSSMPGGAFFGFLFFGLLFLGSVSACLSMLQPGIAFFEEALHASRKKSVSLLGVLTGLGCMFAAFNSYDLKALDTLDFWAGTFLIFVMSTIFTLLFGWVLGIETAFKEAHLGSILHIPQAYRFILKYVCPAFLIIVFTSWLCFDVLGMGGNAIDAHILDLLGSKDTPPNRVALQSFALVIATGGLFSLIASRVSNYKLK